MAVWIVTGKLGSGKTLMAVSRIQKYLLEGRKVATNLDLYPQHLVGMDKKNTEIYRLPDIPTIQSLEAMPRGYDSEEIDERKNGLLVLDECGIFFDSRGWNDPKRKPINAHFKLLRKLRWDAILIIQDIDNLDSDARRTIAEHVAYCRRLDRFKIPFVSWLVKTFTGYDLPLPQLHMALIKYGSEHNSAMVDRWNYYGSRLYDAYDTEQLFSETENYSGIDAICTYLPPYYTHGRYIPLKQRFKDAIKNYKVKSYHFFCIGALMAALTVNALVTFEAETPKKGIWSCNDAYKELFGSCSAKPVAPYEYYYPKPDQTPQDLEQNPLESVTDDNSNSDVIYIAGWNRTTRGVFMNFVDGDGKPFFPTSYRVRRLGDCTASVQIDGITRQLTCMPDHIAYSQPQAPNNS